MKHLLLVVLICGSAASVATASTLVVGSKNFTESVLLGEALRIEAAGGGLSIDHRRALGGTAILWRALNDGEIDIYPEYSGTLTQELLHGLPANADIASLRRHLAPLGIGISEGLGFQDAYALGMEAKVADAAHLTRLSDLAAHSELRFGLSNEFMDRGDGWPGLRDAYGLTTRQVSGMDHALAYRALLAQAVDVVDLYTTDAEIPQYGLRLLIDDRHYFPDYQAVYLYRLDAAKREPRLLDAIGAISGRIPTEAMQRMNADVKLRGIGETAVAAAFLHKPAGGSEASLFARVGRRTLEHLQLVIVSLALAILIGLPLGILAAGWPRASPLILSATSILQTIPSLAMLVFLIPLLGIGSRPAIVALFFYSLLPIVRNTIAGLTGIDPALRDSARAMGLPSGFRLFRIELPLASGAIIAGISIAAVIDVGTATLGALIGAGGYGQPILTGIRLADTGLVLEGAIPAAVMALAVQLGFQLLAARLDRYDRASRAP